MERVKIDPPIPNLYLKENIKTNNFPRMIKIGIFEFILVIKDPKLAKKGHKNKTNNLK